MIIYPLKKKIFSFSRSNGRSYIWPKGSWHSLKFLNYFIKIKHDLIYVINIRSSVIKIKFWLHINASNNQPYITQVTFTIIFLKITL